MKRTTKKQIAMLLVCCMLFTLLPTTALASGTTTTTPTTTTEKNITLGTSALSGYDSTNGYKYVYYGTYDNSPIKWRILSMNGNDGTYKDGGGNTVASTNAMFLLSEYALKQMQYDADGCKNDDSQKYVSSWRYSDAWNWCNDTEDDASFISSSFTDSEKAYFLKTSKGNTSSPYTDELKGDTFFFLSDAEAKNIYNESHDLVCKFSNGKATLWRLRSPLSNGQVAYVGDDGLVRYGTDGEYGHVMTKICTRPAFNLDSSKILFTSVAKDGKRTDNVGTFLTNTESNGKEYKLTMKDSDRKFVVTETTAKGSKGGTVTFNYDKAETGTNEYISAMIVDETDGEVLYYGQLAKATTTSGTIDFIIPSDIDYGTYELKLFNEQINGDYKTDYSSDFETVTLNVLPKATFTTEPAANTLTYNGTEQALITAGNVTTGCTLLYSLKDEENSYSEKIPTGKDATTYSVYYYVKGNDDYASTIPQSIKVTIAKATATVTAKDKTAYVGDAAPDFSNPVNGTDYIINGLCGDDTLDSVTIVLKCNADMSKAGTYEIEPIVSGENKNYNVKYENGTLNVSVKPNEPSGNYYGGGYYEPEKEETIWKNPFTDVHESDWFYHAVKYAHQNKLFAGVSATEFAPNMPMSRGMLVTVLYRLAGSPAVTGDMPFVDVNSDAYYRNAILWAVQNNIVSGVADNLFAPDANITREQIAIILYRFAQYCGYDTSVGEDTNILSYDDFTDINEYAITAMQYAAGSGFLNGRTESTLNPQDTATRAEVAAILQRFIENNQ